MSRRSARAARSAVAGIVLSLSLSLALCASAPPAGTSSPEPAAPAGTLRLIALCESGGDPGAVNVAASETHWDGRTGSYGLYQFGRGTWDDIARRAWLAGLVEVDWSHGYPHHAPPAAQTRLAEILWDAGRGWRHWRACSAQAGWPPPAPAPALTDSPTITSPGMPP